MTQAAGTPIELRKDAWDASYGRGENFLFWPKEETVKFLSRFVRRRTGPDTYQDILDTGHSPLRGLDYGCGIGRQVVLMHEFGIDAYGVDLSDEAIRAARQFARGRGFDDLAERFRVGDGQSLDFADRHFDICLCDSVLDSMPFELARETVVELTRITDALLFVTLISGDDLAHGPDFDGENVVATSHEKGTIQSYYSTAKIERLVDGLPLKMIWGNLIVEQNLHAPGKRGRYHLVFQRQEMGA